MYTTTIDIGLNRVTRVTRVTRTSLTYIYYSVISESYKYQLEECMQNS